MAGSGKVTENTGLFIACAALEFPAASKSMVAQSFPKSTGGGRAGFSRIATGHFNHSSRLSACLASLNV